MLSEFEKKVADFITANQLLDSADKVLLAVSGGADSTALLHSMYALKTESVFDAELLCAHINHQLRGAEANLDEDFVIAQAAELKLAITTKRLNVRGFASRNKLSIETAARKLRIKSLLEMAKADNCKVIATAHQKNDNAETILQRLSRGTGFRGLGGIWPVRAFEGTTKNEDPADKVKFVRPLLCVRRDEIIEYLKERNLKWRQDHTNADCTYRRNYIRHRLLPELQQNCSGSIVEHLSDLAVSARKFYSLVCARAAKSWPELADCAAEKVKLDLKMLLAQPHPVRVELIRRSLTTIGSGERNLTQRHYEKILQLAKQNVGGRKIDLPGTFAVRREYVSLVFARLEKKSHLNVSRSIELKVPGQTRFGRYLIEATIFEAENVNLGTSKTGSFLRGNDIGGKTKLVERFDLDKVKLPLVIRLREAGDRFIPLGLYAEKKVGKFLTAARVPQSIRRRTLIIADSEKIICVWPVRMSEQAKITPGTRKVLQLQIADSNNT